MFQDFTDAIRNYRKGVIDAPGLVTALEKNPFRRTPNPQRVCMAIEIYDLMAPIIGAMMQPPVVLPIIPLPAYCTTPPAPTAFAKREVQEVTQAVVAGMFD